MSRPASAASRPRGAVLGSAAGLIALFALRAAVPAFEKSATFDEPYYVALGYAALAKGDFRFRLNKSMLSMELHAAPLALSGLDLPDPSAPGMDSAQLYGLQFLNRNSLPAAEILGRARLASVLAAVVLAGLVFAAATAIGGEVAGLAALLLFTLSPNMLAHAGLATEDMTVAAFAFASMFAFDSWRRRPTAAAAAAWGLATAGALLSKFSALFLLPSQALLLLLEPRLRPDRRSLRREHAAAAAGAGLLIFFAVYGASPGEYWRAFAQNNAIMLRGYPAFFAGRVSHAGFWYYFLAALALKTTVPTLILAVPSLAVACSARRRLWLAVPVVVLLAASALIPLQAGVRYVLPVYPFLFVLAGLAAAELRPRILAASLLAGAALASFSIAPDYLAYFNELAGGPDHGWRFLVDSNCDWGQDLSGLREYARREGVDAVTLSYFGATTADAVGFPFQDLYSSMLWGPTDRTSPDSPRREILAVSVTNLQGVYLADSYGSDPFAWLKGRAPDARIGHTILVYDAGRDARLHEWLAHMYLAGGRLPQVRREARRALAMDSGAAWGALLAALSAETPDESFALFARAVRLDCGDAVPWREALASPRTREWYATGLTALRAALARRGRRDLAAAADRLLARPEFAAP